jgi:hypothetical protein
VKRTHVLPAIALVFACSSPRSDVGDDGGRGGAASGGSATGGGSSGTAGAASVPTGGSAGAAAGSTGASAGGGLGGSGGSSGFGAGGAGGAGTAGSGAGFAGAAGSAGAAGAAGARPCNLAFPTNVTTTEDLTETRMVSGVFDGGMKRYRGAGALGTSGQEEDQPPLFRLAPGSRLENVVVGAPAADGIHCDGTCTLYNVWWEDVGEDAATLDGDSPTQVMTIECAGAMRAADKIFQHNGPGTMILRNIVGDDFSKFYRSCGNCLEQYERHVFLDTITVRRGTTIVGINENYGDTADFSNIVVYPASGGTTICRRFQANDTGAEPRELDSGPDPDHCRYDESDIDER